MHSLRWHPLLQQWVAVTTARQNRPQMPANWCPFDPGSGKVPDHYDVYLYPNDFPAFSLDQPPFHPVPGLYAETSPQGACDVVLYSPEHGVPPSQLPLERWRKVIDLWTARSREHASNPVVAQIAVFENCGEAVGVTMPHPHGQIYALPFLSPDDGTRVRRPAQTRGSQPGRVSLLPFVTGRVQEPASASWPRIVTSSPSCHSRRAYPRKSA